MMTIDKIRTTLPNKTVFGPLTIKIDSGGHGGRYRAFIDAPNFTGYCETPGTVPVEGILTFCDRLAPKIYEIWSKVSPRAPDIANKTHKHEVKRR